MYDVLNQVIPYQKLLKDILNEVGEVSHSRILDLGAGTGNLCKLLKSSTNTVVALDYSKEALEVCLKKVNDVNIIVQSILEPLPFEDNYFDIVVSNNTLYTINTSKQLFVIKEIERILRPGGNLILSNLKCGFSPMKIYFEHIRLKIRQTGILGAIIQVVTMIVPTVKMFYYNNKIKKANQNEDYHFFRSGEQESLVIQAGMRIKKTLVSYAGQNIIVVGEKY